MICAHGAHHARDRQVNHAYQTVMTVIVGRFTETQLGHTRDQGRKEHCVGFSPRLGHHGLGHAYDYTSESYSLHHHTCDQERKAWSDAYEDIMVSITLKMEIVIIYVSPSRM